MTYCLAIRVDQGLVFAGDTRSNAGVDYVASYRKLHLFDAGNDRQLALLTAGSLATTQELISWLQRDLDASDGRESLRTVQHMFEAASYVGRISRAVQDQHEPALQRSGASGEVSMILGGQIQGGDHELFLIYPQGNFIHASEDTPYLQIGESKYGKPMLDRIVDPQLTLDEAARLALISLDATVRSNVTVGLPFDVGTYVAGSFGPLVLRRFGSNDEYFRKLRETWQNNIRSAFSGLPPIPQQ